MASRKQEMLGKYLDHLRGNSVSEEQALANEGGRTERQAHQRLAGWSFFGLFGSNTVENAQEHLRKWAEAYLKKDGKAAQKEQRWFNDNDWTMMPGSTGSPPFYDRMIWQSKKLKKRIGVTIANNTYNIDVPSSI
jgi:hypothetical protein